MQTADTIDILKFGSHYLDVVKRSTNGSKKAALSSIKERDIESGTGTILEETESISNSDFRIGDDHSPYSNLDNIIKE